MLVDASIKLRIKGDLIKEFSSNYYAVIANYITSLPFEMIDLMKIRDFMRMKVLIQNFLFS